MKKNITITLANYIIVILLFTLVSLLTYNFYILFNKLTNPKLPPKNSMRVSPLTGENINVDASNQIIHVDYNSNNIEELSFIENSSMIFERFDNTTLNHSYSALFSASNIKLDNSMSIITYAYSKSIPNLNFLNPNELLGNGFIEHNNTIDIHYSSERQISIPFSMLKYNISESLHVDNIIIQFPKNNSAIVFTNGLYKVFDSSTNLSICPGKSYFIILESKLPITY